MPRVHIGVPFCPGYVSLTLILYNLFSNLISSIALIKIDNLNDLKYFYDINNSNKLLLK